MSIDLLTSEINKLNPQQRQAVEALEGPVLVVAGPGTGKTQVLSLRIANILQKTDATASNILCITFTESGVRAMRERLQRFIGSEAYYVKIHTFHSFCNEVIQSNSEKFAFARELNQLEDLGRLKLMREVLESFPSDQKLELRPFHNPYHYEKEIINNIQTLKREGWDAERFSELAMSQEKDIAKTPEISARTKKPTAAWNSAFKYAKRNLELSQIYTKYQELMLERGLYDYEDMILFVINKFKNDDDLLASFQERFLYILVDEYQDTNGSQNELIKLLGSFDNSPNIFAVGDDDQAIYRFQGANVENLLFFTSQFSDVQTIPVTTNYRSSQMVLDLAESLIEKNQSRLVNFIPGLEKHLVSGIGTENKKATFAQVPTAQAECEYVVESIKKLIEKGVPAGEIAILYRRHSDAEDISEALLKAEIPINLSAGRNALDERVVQKLINILRCIEFTDKQRDLLLAEVLFYDFLGFDRLDAFKIIRAAHDSSLSIFDIITDSDKLGKALVANPAAILNFASQLLEFKSFGANTTLMEQIEKVGKDLGYLEYVFSDESNPEDINAVNSFYQYVRALNYQNKELTLTSLLSDIDLLKEQRIAIPEQELILGEAGVNLMTAHRSKGLEFSHVFIIKFYDGNWGGGVARSSIKLPREVFELTEKHEQAAKGDIEDERRLLFVAITRAKEQVHFSLAQSYPSGNASKETVASQFLTEINKTLIQDIEVAASTNLIEKLSPIPAKDYSEAEQDYLKSLIEKLRLSASALNAYIRCPLQFKFDYLLRVPRSRRREESLGTSIHFAFEHFFRKLKEGETKDLPYLQFLFQQQLERELLSSEDFAVTKTEGLKLLKDYYENYQGKFVAPTEVEYAFYGRNLVLEIAESDPIILSGKLDKIEWIDKQSGEVKVVDYKVSNPKSENDIRGLTKNSDGSIFRQLTFYKLLGDLDPNFRFQPAAPKYEITHAEIDFVRQTSTGGFKKVNLEIKPEDVEVLKLKIAEVMKEVRGLKFNGTDEYPLCGECEYCERFSR